MTGVTAVILAGGLGTRLRSVVADKPKVLAEVRGRPFLTYLFDQVAQAGITRVVVCTGYLGEQICDAFGDSYETLDLRYSQEDSPLGTAGALRLALPMCLSEHILVMNGDSYCDAHLSTFYRWFRAHQAAAAIVANAVPDTARYGRIELEPDGRILEFVEKQSSGDAGWINGGIYLLPRDLLSTIPENAAISLEREIFPTWIRRGLYGYRNSGNFLDIGTPESYAAAEAFFSQEAMP